MSRLRAVFLAVLALSVLQVPSPAAAEPGVDHSHIPTGSIFYTAASTEDYAGYPAVFDAGSTAPDGSRSSRIMLAYNSKRDLPGERGNRIRQSTDGGVTWPDYPSADGALQVSNLVRLAIASGGVITIDFEDLSVTQPSCTDLSICRRQFNRRMMTPTSWVDAGTATVTFSQAIAWSRFNQGPLLLGDGKTMLATMYGIYTAGSVPFTVVVRSTDAGVTWTEVAQLATGAGWNEANLAPTSDGGLIAVQRKDENPVAGIPANVALYTRKAPTQSGTGWGAAVRLSSDGGNSPSVKMLGNGSLALASGRPDNLLRISFDGKGTSWTAPVTVYKNNPTTGGRPDGWHEGGGAADRPMRHLGSSGTVGIMPIGGNRLLATGDNCASGWGCPADVGGPNYTATNALWKSWVEVDTDQWGKADLTTMFRRGELTVLDPTLSRYGYCPGDTAGCRASLAAYAFDGDPRTDASLVTPNRGVTMRLPRPVDVTGLGLHVNLQGSTDVRLETSLDGTTWSTPARGARDGIVRPFTAPVRAQYVRISDPNPITDPTAAFLHEVELYTTLDGFEHDYPGQAPRGNGLTSSTMATVVDQSTVSAADRISSRFLRLRDDSASAGSVVGWTHASSTAATVEFRVRAYGQANNSVSFTMRGADGTAAYHFHLNAAGRLYRWDAALQSWGTQLNATALVANAWNTLRVEATAGGTARLYANGQLVATVAPTDPAAGLGRFELSSAGTIPTGDDWLVDDVGYTAG
ncbi:hypothetical protein [Actinophytocola sp.]|uniref:hypothetical protein n=1 Tax=Actinophytocola sp. TaxID=1872138 RepID=UPI002EDA18FE